MIPSTHVARSLPPPPAASRDGRLAVSERLCEGLRVVDAASFIAGPVATTMLADFGADVVKIEPPEGDPYRHRTSGPGVPESPYNYRWIVDNRNKRGLALDLRQPQERAGSRWAWISLGDHAGDS